MKMFIVGAAALAFASLTGVVRYELPDRTPSLQAEVLNATVKIEAGRGSGSGIAIDARHIITNHHVLFDASDDVLVRGWIRKDDRVYPVVYNATIIASDETADLAILRIEADWAGSVARIAAAEPDEGETVYKSGAAHGMRPMVTTGNFGGLQTMSGRKNFMHSAATTSGDSGGGLWTLNDAGYELVSITYATGSISGTFERIPLPTMGLGIPLQEVLDFISLHIEDAETEARSSGRSSRRQ